MNKQETADLVLMNGVIFTSRDDVPVVQALAIKQGKIIETGSDERMEKHISSETKKIDLEGKFACPGFNDAHIHFMGGGLYAKRLNLEKCASPGEIAQKVKEKALQLKKGEWILGRGWDQTSFPDKQWPTKDILDSVSPENPVFLRRVDGHVAWMNSFALKLAGIDRRTKSPEGGEIAKDAITGEPTGILKESAADLVYDLIPKPSKSDIREAIEYALNEAKKYGITSIQDNSDAQALAVYEELAKEGKLTVRVSEWLDYKDDLSECRELKKKYSSSDGMIRFFTLKGYVDGTLGSRTAAMIEPYTDEPSMKGLLQMPEEKLKALVKRGHEEGFQIALHAIGDCAVREALDSFEALGVNGRRARNRVEHAQIINATDLPRFKSLNVIASMQAIHCISDKKWAEERIGKERSKGAYAWKSILSSGAKLCFGTDWPVESMNPLLGLYAAVTRASLSEAPQDGWIPEQRITMEDALKCYSTGSAYAEYAEHYKGTLEKGKVADIVILSKDLLKINPQEILNTEVTMTIFNGNVVYEKK